MESSTRLDNLLSIWREQRDAGLTPTPEEICKESPELLPQFQEKVKLLAYMEKLLQSADASSKEIDPDETSVYQKSDGTIEIPDQIGRYNIQGEIARGGMGAVFRAHDPDFDRTLAIKIALSKGRNREQAESRFVEEARIAGRLQHPGIPPVHELGRLPDGRPYFAMKLIEGRTLSHLLKERPNTGNDLTHFLGVFEQICQTIAYAHSRDIIHRDLKPLNIMVGAFGEVQVMDWGLAKVLKLQELNSETSDSVLRSGKNEIDESNHNEGTRVGTVLGTLSYMAPEQARGEIHEVDKASDVFGLGAILCELLIGKPPYAGRDIYTLLSRVASGDWQEARNELEKSDVDADLVTITKKCLATKKHDRFANAGELANAISQYQDSVQERLKQTEHKRIAADAKALEEQKRRRTQLTAVSVILMLLIATIIGTVWGMIQINDARNAESIAKIDAQKKEGIAIEAAKAEKQAKLVADAKRKEAEENLKFARNSNQILGSMFTNLDPRANYQTVADFRKAMTGNIQKAIEELNNSAIGDPLEVARMQNILGDSLIGIGIASHAIDTLETAFQTRKSILGPTHNDTLICQNNLAIAYQDANMLKKALPMFATALEIRRKTLGKRHPATMTSMNNLGMAYLDEEKLDLAMPLLQEAFDLRMANLGLEDPDTLLSMSNLALCYRLAGKLNLATRLYEDTFKIRKTRLGPYHPDTIVSMNNLGMAYTRADEFELGLPLLEDSLAIQKTKIGIDNSDTLVTMNNLGMGYMRAGKLELALSMLEETLKLRKSKFGPAHSDTLVSMNNLADCYQKAGQIRKALPLLEEAIELKKKNSESDTANTLIAMNNLGVVYLRLGMTEKAVPMLEAVLGKQKVKNGADHPDTLNTTNNLAEAYRISGKLDLALPLFESAAQGLIRKWGLTHSNAVGAQVNLLYAYKITSDNYQQWQIFLEGLSKNRRLEFGDSDPRTLMAMTGLGACYRKANKLDLAQPLLEKAFRLRHKHLLGGWVGSELVALYLAKGIKAEETKTADSLTEKKPENVHIVKLSADSIYAIDMKSKDFDTYLRIEDENGKRISENDDIDLARKILDSRLVIVPRSTGEYRIVATSYQNKGRGSYEIIIRDFSGVFDMDEKDDD